MEININGKPFQVKPGTSVAAAVMNANIPSRSSIGERPRSPLCGMGICYECRLEINGVKYERACMVLCSDGMEVDTGG